MIRKRGKKYVLYSHEGKTLGEHPTRAAAAKQERAIQISKARAAGAQIPRARR